MAILPTYLSIVETLSRIRQKWDEPVNLNWLLQFSREGKIQLFALARSAGFASVTEIVDTDYVISGGKVGRIFRSDFNSPDNLESNRLRASSHRPLIEPISEVAFSNSSIQYYPGKRLFDPGDYLPVTLADIGRILASKSSRRSGVILATKGSDEDVYIFNWSEKGCTRSLWVVDENDLFFKTTEIDEFVKSATVGPRRSTTLFSEAVRIGLLKYEILAAPWPCKNKLEKILTAVPRWIELALVSRGSPGRASRWNPAEIAICLASNSKCLPWSANHEAVESFLTQHFPDYADYWLDRKHFL